MFQNSQKQEDSLPACKYGAECYQRNSVHLEKYRHPPKKRTTQMTLTNLVKRQKVEPVAKEPQDSCNGSSSTSKEKLVDSAERNVNEELTCTEIKNDSNLEENIPETGFRNVNCDYSKKDFIKEKFLFDMPRDFYSFYDLCKSLNRNPSQAFKIANLELVGPYDVLADKFLSAPEKKPEEYLTHWRYYYDPPEFQTVIKGDDNTGFHLGYFRDDPKELPVFVASNHGLKDGVFEIVGENIFAAVNLYLEDFLKKCGPFQKLEIIKLQKAVKKKAEELHLDLAKSTANIKKRNSKIVTRSFNKLGLVVPYDKKKQLGYRELAVSDKNLRQLFDRLGAATPEEKNQVLSVIQPVLTFANIATDECDYGTGIELGWNIIAHGVEGMNFTAQTFLSISYNLIHRPEFAKIAEAHMKNRKKGTALSIL